MKRKTFDNYDYEEAFPVELDRDIQKKARKNFEKEHPLQVPDYEEQWKEQQEKLKEWELERLLKEAYTNIKNVFSNIGSFFSGIWDTIKGIFTNVGTNIGEAIGGAFKSAMNNALATVERAVNKAIGFINGAIDIINDIPGVSIGHVGEVSLPRLAKGGVLKNGQAIMAEAGPELIQMVNGEAVVTPLTASARNTALETAEGGGKSFVQNVNITSPKALSPYETARQTRNATRNMVLQLQGG